MLGDLGCWFRLEAGSKELQAACVAGGGACRPWLSAIPSAPSAVLVEDIIPNPSFLSPPPPRIPRTPGLLSFDTPHCSGRQLLMSVGIVLV